MTPLIRTRPGPPPSCIAAPESGAAAAGPGPARHPTFAALAQVDEVRRALLTGAETLEVDGLALAYRRTGGDLRSSSDRAG
jgi:hypothetical protein